MSICVRMDYYMYLASYIYMHARSHHTHTRRWFPELSFWGCLLYAVICVSAINFILEASVSCDIDDKYGSMACQRVCATMCVRRCVCVCACMRLRMRV